MWVDESGNPMAPPAELTRALTVDALAQRYGCLPTEILAADAENMRIAELAAMWRDSDEGV